MWLYHALWPHVVPYMNKTKQVRDRVFTTTGFVNSHWIPELMISHCGFTVIIVMFIPHTIGFVNSHWIPELMISHCGFTVIIVMFIPHTIFACKIIIMVV